MNITVIDSSIPYSMKYDIEHGTWAIRWIKLYKVRFPSDSLVTSSWSDYRPIGSLPISRMQGLNRPLPILTKARCLYSIGNLSVDQAYKEVSNTVKNPIGELIKNSYRETSTRELSLEERINKVLGR